MTITNAAVSYSEWVQCPVCDGDERSEYVGFTALTFSRCEACSTVYKSKEQQGLLPSGFYEQAYFQGRKSGRDRRFERRVRKAMGEISDAMNFVQARSVLDVGCSLGYVLEAGRRLGLTSAGLDISAHAVKVCRERGFAAEVGTLDALPFADACFDVVVMKHVLEHTPQPRVALGEVRRVLRPGGVVVIAVPNVDYWKGDKRRTSYRYYRPDDLGAQHYVYYSEATLETRLKRSGFEVMTFGKTQPRKALARRSAWWRLSEPPRALAWRFGRMVGKAVKLQREVYAVARVTY